MNQNVGSADGVPRTVTGAVAGAVSIAVLAGALSPVFGVITVVMLTTAAVGTCPVYAVSGVDSGSRGSNPS